MISQQCSLTGQGNLISIDSLRHWRARIAACWRDGMSGCQRACDVCTVFLHILQVLICNKMDVYDFKTCHTTEHAVVL